MALGAWESVGRRTLKIVQHSDEVALQDCSAVSPFVPPSFVWISVIRGLSPPDGLLWQGEGPGRHVYVY